MDCKVHMDCQVRTTHMDCTERMDYKQRIEGNKCYKEDLAHTDHMVYAHMCHNKAVDMDPETGRRHEDTNSNSKDHSKTDDGTSTSDPTDHTCCTDRLDCTDSGGCTESNQQTDVRGNTDDVGHRGTSACSTESLEDVVELEGRRYRDHTGDCMGCVVWVEVGYSICTWCYARRGCMCSTA